MLVSKPIICQAVLGSVVAADGNIDGSFAKRCSKGALLNFKKRIEVCDSRGHTRRESVQHLGEGGVCAIWRGKKFYDQE